MRVVLITGILFGYYSLQVYLISHLERIFPDSFSAVKDSLRKFLTLLALFVLYKGVELLFPLDKAKSYLGRAYVINTELVKVSLLSLIESLFIFFFFLSLTALLKNLAYVYYMNRGKEVEAGSIRALISNTGLLLTATLSLVHLGITWKVMIPIAGAVGVGLGFGLQTIFNNYVSGFILLLSKNIKVGDLVEIEGQRRSCYREHFRDHIRSGCEHQHSDHSYKDHR
ncbi:MAG: mechanosensitive ion channel [Aquificota bacterium]|nr:mechanosensitive ion channel [Aquificota bacterium]